MGQRRSKRRAVRFQGIPGGVARVSVPRRVVTSCSTPVGSKRRWCDLKSFVYTRVAWRTAFTKSNLDFVYNRSLPDSVYTRSLPDSVYTRSFPDFVYTRWCSSIHTSVRGAASAWAAETRLPSDCDGVCTTAFEKCVSWAMALVGAGWYLQYPQW